MRLEPFGEIHLEALTAMLGDPDILRFTRVPEPTPPDFARAWLEGYEAGRRDGTREAFAAIGASVSGDEASGRGREEFLGLALVPSIDREAREVELGYLVAPAARGRGVATAILRELTRWAFEQGALRAELVIDVDNPASERVAERCGYLREGVLRSIHFKGEQRMDATLWSRLPSDAG
jgi:RimJ/RimL family protein N-acetyltransferase